MTFFLELKHSAQKEFDALDDTVFARIDRKISGLAGQPTARRMQ